MTPSRKKTGLMVFALSMLTLLTPPIVCPAEIQLIRIENRDAAELLPVVEALLSETGKVSVDRGTNSLIVKDGADVLQTVRKAVTDLDQAPEQLTIRFRFDEEDLFAERAGRVLAKASEDDWSVGTADRAEDGVHAEVHDVKQDRNHQGDFSITVLSGNTAYVRTGMKIPFTNRWAYFTGRYAHTGETVNLETVETGFEVRPTVSGSNVRLEIVPRIAHPDPHQGQTIRFTEASTVLVLPRGKWVTLSKNRGEANEVVGEILSGRKTNNADRCFLSVFVEP
jgi:type II secretory pathway component GspD/PulD (secretin)